MSRINDRGHDGGNVWRWQTLEKYVIENNWKKGAELGVWHGETFKHLIRACPELHLIGVDLYEAQPGSTGPERWTPGENGHAWDHVAYYHDLMNFSSQYPNRAVIIKDYTTEAAKQVEDESLDFVFIDADHSYEGVMRDVQAWAPKVRKGGIVFGHDIHFDTVKRAVNELYGDTYNVEDDFVWLVEKQ
jgi:hypothetical protein